MKKNNTYKEITERTEKMIKGFFENPHYKSMSEDMKERLEDRHKQWAFGAYLLWLDLTSEYKREPNDLKRLEAISKGENITD